jgi:hypothetical protein
LDKATALAADCLIVAALFMLNRTQPNNPIDFSSLPKLDATIEFESMGFEVI